MYYQKLELKCIAFFHKSHKYNSYKGIIGKVKIIKQIEDLKHQ